jgi:hypothetical protein
MDGEDQDRERQEYLEERTLLITGEVDAAKSLDQAMLTVSAAFLGLSITFVEQIAAKPPKAIWTLALAWILLGLALLSTLTSFYVAQLAYRKEREIHNRIYRGEKGAQNAKNTYSTVIAWLNILSIISFIVGVIFLGTFTIQNLPYQ